MSCSRLADRRPTTRSFRQEYQIYMWKNVSGVVWCLAPWWSRSNTWRGRSARRRVAVGERTCSRRPTANSDYGRTHDTPPESTTASPCFRRHQGALRRPSVPEDWYQRSPGTWRSGEVGQHAATVGHWLQLNVYTRWRQLNLGHDTSLRTPDVICAHTVHHYTCTPRLTTYTLAFFSLQLICNLVLAWHDIKIN